MIRPRLLILALAGLVALAAAAPAAAGAPTDQLKGAIDRVISTIESPALKGEGKVMDRRREVRKIANDIFDFGEISRRSLARHWQGLSDRDREEFIVLFGDLLERSYVSRIEQYGGEKIQYTGEKVEGDLAVVSSKIIAKGGTEVPVDYRMLRRGDRWLVYDVSIEGVSLVANYRTQFNKIIQTSSYKDLVKKMKAKQDEAVFEDESQKRARTRTQ
jgi:phospholipid transport system substrate-binding protein